MKFDRKNILDILSVHQNNIDRKAINSIFSSIRILSDANTLKISSLDGERFLEYTLIEQISKCDILLPGINFYELLKKSNSEFFELIEKEKTYVIKVGNGEFKFAKQKDTAPPVWQDTYEHEVEINAASFATALKLVKWAASTDEGRPFLNGVCLDITNDKINFCATDGLKLALHTIEQKTNIEQGTWIIGKKSVNDLIKLLENAKDNARLFLGKNAQVLLHTDNAQIVWRTLLVAGKFPQYEKIIPNSFVANFSINANEFKEVLERMLIIANYHAPIVTIQFNANSCEIFAENPLASGQDFLPGQYSGPDLKIAFNAKFLIEIIQNFNEMIVIQLNNPYSPVSIKSSTLRNATFVLAPVKRD